jgi:hypothetical protein
MFLFNRIRIWIWCLRLGIRRENYRINKSGEVDVFSTLREDTLS